MELVGLKRDSKLELDEKLSQLSSLEFQLRNAKSQVEEKELMFSEL